MQLSDQQLAAHNAELRHLDAKRRIAYLHKLAGGDVVMSTSFGETSAVLLHLCASVIDGMEVVFVENGHESATTRQARDTLPAALGLKLVTVRAPTLVPPPEGTPEFAVFQRRSKSEPFDAWLKERRPAVWLSGVRRDETTTRGDFDFLMRSDYCFAGHPILDWTRGQCYDYCERFGLMINDFHYDPTKGSGQNLECGLHLGKRVKR